MLSQVMRSVGIGSLLLSSLSLCIAGNSNPAESPPDETPKPETRIENPPPADTSLERKTPLQQQQPREQTAKRQIEQLPTQPPICPPPLFPPLPAPHGRWVQKELTFRVPVIVPEGFPLPEMPVPGQMPVPGFAPSPEFARPAFPPAPLPQFTIPQWALTPSDPDPGSLRLDEQVETDAFGNQWLVRRKTWTSRGAVCSAMSRVPHVPNRQPRVGGVPDGAEPAAPTSAPTAAPGTPPAEAVEPAPEPAAPAPEPVAEPDAAPPAPTPAPAVEADPEPAPVAREN